MYIKRLLSLILVFLSCLFYSGTALAQDNLTDDVLIKVKEAAVFYLDSPMALVNGEKRVIDLSDAEITPVVKNGRTLLPLRFVSESLGAKVDWNSKSNTATVYLGDIIVKITLGNEEMIVNNKVSTLNVPAELRQGRTYIPLRALAEALNRKVFFHSGLIVISNEDNILDPILDSGIIDELIFQCTGIGNSTGNLMNDAAYAQYGDWLVFYNPFDNDRLYKSKFDGLNKTKLSNDIPFSINFIGNWIYYATPSGTRKTRIGDSLFDETIFDIYKIRIDGSGRTKISTEKSLNWLAVAGNWIYYVNEHNQLSKIKVDGTQRTRIGDQLAEPYNICVSNGWIYYQTPYNWESEYFQNGLWKIKTDGTERSKILNEMIPYAGFDVVGDTIFYCSDYYCDNPGFYRMKSDGTEKVQISSNSVPSQMNISGEWVCFWEYKDNGALYRMKLDGTQKTKLSDVHAYRLGIVGDWIFYQCNWVESNVYPVYRIRLDGSGKTRVGG
ncbi:DUF5050 domain-containing protein [Phosphitispora fastidiosa]|uniref:DUF5050 domain-containing protein n=1 Tax=Phosphitispora fastidiosa TaxID=2837202 RepID=UPI001E5146BD|nr:DUF5050 domain-containing protein [Phosphitispora fastidiosa]MBU7007527.1 hypothetical protein [Phosphitispora fastidiosa]